MSPTLQTLLTDMLEFNPNKRKSARELLANKVFDSYRKASLEEPASSTVTNPDLEASD